MCATSCVHSGMRRFAFDTLQDAKTHPFFSPSAQENSPQNICFLNPTRSLDSGIHSQLTQPLIQEADPVAVASTVCTLRRRILSADFENMFRNNTKKVSQGLYLVKEFVKSQCIQRDHKQQTNTYSIWCKLVHII